MSGQTLRARNAIQGKSIEVVMRTIKKHFPLGHTGRTASIPCIKRQLTALVATGQELDLLVHFEECKAVKVCQQVLW